MQLARKHILTFVWFLLSLSFSSMAGCCYPSKADAQTDQRILIVYLSRTQNTKALAEIIHGKVGGDMVALELKTAYPSHYQTMVDQVSKENQTGYLPLLQTKIDDIEKYDLVFVGFPTWGMQLPPPIKSFLKTHDLRGKTIVPFNTNAGYGLGNSLETIVELSPGSKILACFTSVGGKEKDGVLFVMQGKKKQQMQAEVEHWLKKLALLN